MIEEYNFGVINVDGKVYNYDVETRWTGEVLKWERKEGHIVNVEDVKRAVDQNPDTIVICTGEVHDGDCPRSSGFDIRKWH